MLFALHNICHDLTKCLRNLYNIGHIQVDDCPQVECLEYLQYVNAAHFIIFNHHSLYPFPWHLQLMYRSFLSVVLDFKPSLISL